MAGNVRGWTASLDAPCPYRFDSGLFAILLLAAMRPSEPPLKCRFLGRDKRLSAFRRAVAPHHPRPFLPPGQKKVDASPPSWYGLL